MVFKRTFLGFIPFGLEPQLNDKYFENMKHPFFINHHYIFFIVSVANSRHVLKCPLDHFQSQEEFYLSGLLGKENDFLPKNLTNDKVHRCCHFLPRKEEEVAFTMKKISLFPFLNFILL